MKQRATRVLFIFSCLAIIPGCGRLIDWTKDHFNQSNTLDVDRDIAKRYLRSSVVYDQFSTVAMFDALWLSDEIRTLYTDLYVRKNGRGEQQRKAFLRRQLEENNHYISFYVLSLYDVPLMSENQGCANWSLFLRVGEHDFFPIEIKSVELPPEYRDMFCKRFNRFKSAYRIKFEATDIEGNLILAPGVKQMAFYFRSIEKEAVMVWLLDSDSNAVMNNN